MINFIKNLFKKKEIVKEEVKLEDLFDWFSAKIKEEIKDINSEVKEETGQLKHELSGIKKNLSSLEDAKPDPKLKVLPKVKQTVDGHRANYIRRIKLFLGRVKFPDDIDYLNIPGCCKVIDEELDHIAKTTMKSFYATQHLYYKELEEVGKNLKNVSSAVGRIKKIFMDPRIREFGTVKKDIKEIEKGKDMAAEVGKEIDDGKKREKALEILKEQTDKKLIEVRGSEEYRNYNDLVEDEKELKDKKRLEESKLFNIFSPLDAALKKYERIAMDGRGQIAGYLAYPLKALLDDKELQILGILENVKKNIENGSIELKDKKKIKTLESIKRITKEELKSFIKEYKRINDEIEDIQGDLKSAERVVTEEKRLKDKLVRLGDDIRLADMKILTLKDKMKDMDLEKTRRDVVHSVRNLLDIELEIR